jgi:hypothetical protein
MNHVEGSRCDVVQCKICLEVLRNNANIMSGQIVLWTNLKYRTFIYERGQFPI